MKSLKMLRSRAVSVQQKASKHAGKAVLTVGVLASQGAFALGTTEETAITAAVDGGSSAVQLVVAGVIAIAAIVTGAGIVMSWLKK